MRNFLKILIVVAALSSAIFISYYHIDSLHFLVGKIGFGWVIGSIFIRLICIILMFIIIKQIFGLFKKTAPIKNWIIALICLLPGIGISFITPIYTSDFGDLSDDLILSDTEMLQLTLQDSADFPSEKFVLAFLSVGCDFCAEATQKLGTNLIAGQDLQVVSIFCDPPEYVDQFLEMNGGTSFDARITTNCDYFIRSAGGSFPSIFLLDENKNTMDHWVGGHLNYSALDYLRSL